MDKNKTVIGVAVFQHQSQDGVLKRYIEDIRQTKPISRSEEQVLFQRLKSGSRSARSRLVSCNMRFVLKVALQYRGCSVPLVDLVNEGSMGLIRAIESYDDSRGIKFISYAVWWIKAFITRAINENGSLIRLPANQHLKVRRALRESVGTDLPLDSSVQELMSISSQGDSFDQPIAMGSRNTLAEILVDSNFICQDAQFEIEQMDEQLNNWLSLLTDKQKTIIMDIYGLVDGSPRSIRASADRLNLSHERARQLRDQALRKLRTYVPLTAFREKFELYLSAVG